MIDQCSSQGTGSHLWGLSRISSRSVPDYSSAIFSHNSDDGVGIRVYVHDSGIRLTHQDFAGRGEFGKNFAGGRDDDINGHGTHCAGIILGTEFGVAKGATLVSVKVINDNAAGTVSHIIAGLDWMVEDVQSREVRGIASMSIGTTPVPSLDSAINSADAAGIPVVVAAGNNNADACNFSPARASGAITVGATDINDRLSAYSMWGPCVDILAPGNEILSASHLSDTGSRTLTGTSMSCPHVSGLVARYLSDNPSASTSQVKAYLLRTATQDAIDLRGTAGTPNCLVYSSCP